MESILWNPFHPLLTFDWNMTSFVMRKIVKHLQIDWRTDRQCTKCDQRSSLVLSAKKVTILKNNEIQVVDLIFSWLLYWFYMNVFKKISRKSPILSKSYIMECSHHQNEKKKREWNQCIVELTEPVTWFDNCEHTGFSVWRKYLSLKWCSISPYTLMLFYKK